jgi:hypothetical protein
VGFLSHRSRSNREVEEAVDVRHDRAMGENARERARRYDAIGRAAITYGPLVVVIIGTADWLISLWTEGGFVDVTDLMFRGALIGAALLWVFFRLQRKRPNP